MLSYRILTGDVRETLKSLPDGCVQTCVTSPPYWGLRDYGHSGQIGLEPAPDAYVAGLVAVFREVRRVLADDGTVWLNLGDSYCASAPGVCADPMSTSGLNGISGVTYRADRTSIRAASRDKTFPGLKPKDLVGIPWRVAFALQADGWYLRSDIIWSKPNPMPESVTDRPTKAHEYIFLLTKSARYYYDSEAICELASDAMVMQMEQGYIGEATKDYDSAGAQNPSSVKARIIAGKRRQGFTSARAEGGMGIAASGNEGRPYHEQDWRKPTRNKRSVWHVATQPYADAHFATFPEALIEPCILAGSKPGDTVLDPFAGSGTSGVVAIRHQRNFIGCELNPDYVKLTEKRIGAVAPLFAERTA
jgi:DNA modification methylase